MKKIETREELRTLLSNRPIWELLEFSEVEILRRWEEGEFDILVDYESSKIVVQNLEALEEGEEE